MDPRLCSTCIQMNTKDWEEVNGSACTAGAGKQLANKASGHTKSFEGKKITNAEQLLICRAPTTCIGQSRVGFG